MRTDKLDEATLEDATEEIEEEERAGAAERRGVERLDLEEDFDDFAREEATPGSGKEPYTGMAWPSRGSRRELSRAERPATAATAMPTDSRAERARGRAEARRFMGGRWVWIFV